MSGDQIGGILRAILAAVGGYFVGQGLLDQGTAEQIGGALAVIGTAVWSFWTKRAAKPA